MENHLDEAGNINFVLIYKHNCIIRIDSHIWLTQFHYQEKKLPTHAYLETSSFVLDGINPRSCEGAFLVYFVNLFRANQFKSFYRLKRWTEANKYVGDPVDSRGNPNS